ncbi:phosphopantetheine-binding protein [Vibrio sinus]|uniref:phosphopantetheine-binding protein n=1 Tax=Vibrio sinus TaxID=2946865 RepID=UPI003D6F3D26
MMKNLVQEITLSATKEMASILGVSPQADVSTASHFIDLGINSIDRTELLSTITERLSLSHVPVDIALSDTVGSMINKILPLFLESR